MSTRLPRQLISRVAFRRVVAPRPSPLWGTRCLLNLRGQQLLLLPTSCHSRRWLSDDNKSSEDQENPVAGIDRSKFTHEIEIRMPDMGEGGGKIIQWFKKEGDMVLRDDILCDIETPDFSFGMVTDDECDAIMGKILVEANSEPVKDNEVICTVFHPSATEQEVKAKTGDDVKAQSEQK